MSSEAATHAAFAKAAKVVKLTAYRSRVIGNPMEPRAAMGSYDAARDLYFLHGTTQGVGPMRGQLSAVLGVPPEKVRVVAEEVGGPPSAADRFKIVDFPVPRSPITKCIPLCN